jgi:hypothetical protein
MIADAGNHVKQPHICIDGYADADRMSRYIENLRIVHGGRDSSPQ